MAKPIYPVRTADAPALFTLTHFRPEGVPGPKTVGSLCRLPDALELTMRCYEEHPKAVYTQPNDPVHTDSCMEAFFDCFPELPDYGYVNVEINANGAVHCCFGPSRACRRPVLELTGQHPEAAITRGQENRVAYWQARCRIAYTLLEQLYERPCQLRPGHQMRGNFYKCGDETDAPHWQSWSEVGRLDFHTPEFFGTLSVE